MKLSWPAYLIALAIVLLGLMAAESFAPRVVPLLVLALVLGVAVTHPTFSRELSELSRRLRSG
jgi:uncharacterized membrane protein AbrB (regulator of aidB expression)